MAGAREDFDTKNARSIFKVHVWQALAAFHVLRLVQAFLGSVGGRRLRVKNKAQTLCVNKFFRCKNLQRAAPANGFRKCAGTGQERRDSKREQKRVRTNKQASIHLEWEASWVAAAGGGDMAQQREIQTRWSQDSDTEHDEDIRCAGDIKGV